MRSAPLGIVLGLGLAGLTGCSSPPSPSELLAQVQDDSASTADQVRAIRKLRLADPQGLVPELLRLLDHPEPGMRLFAQEQLAEILGREVEFPVWGTVAERRSASEKLRRRWAEERGEAGRDVR